MVLLLPVLDQPRTVAGRDVSKCPAIAPCLVTRAMSNVCEFALYSDRGHEILGTREALDFLYRMVAAD